MDRVEAIKIDGIYQYHIENMDITFPHYALLADVTIEEGVLPDGNSEYNLYNLLINHLNKVYKYDEYIRKLNEESKKKLIYL